MSVKTPTVFKIFAGFLSLLFAALLFPAIVGRYGLLLSVFYTGLGVSVIWLAYFGIGRFIEWTVEKELERKNL
jgi:hypothetical protein